LAVCDAALEVVDAVRVAHVDSTDDLSEVALEPELELLDSALADLKCEWDWESEREWLGAA
jgi:hypothetical protein